MYGKNRQLEVLRPAVGPERLVYTTRTLRMPAQIVGVGEFTGTCTNPLFPMAETITTREPNEPAIRDDIESRRYMFISVTFQVGRLLLLILVVLAQK